MRYSHFFILLGFEVLIDFNLLLAFRFNAAQHLCFQIMIIIQNLPDPQQVDYLVLRYFERLQAEILLTSVYMFEMVSIFQSAEACNFGIKFMIMYTFPLL